MDPTVCAETSERNYHDWLRNKPEGAQFSSISRRKPEMAQSYKLALHLMCNGRVGTNQVSANQLQYLVDRY
jgi:hypothetical protein